MYRLLIVDDEPIIVDGLIKLFSESEMNFEIHSAYSVQEAIDLALKIKIDLVISDMRMPGKNGLQFVDELHLLWPQCRVIFLSGYDEFEYVYDAVKRKIDGYILKTEDDEVLMDTVKSSIKQIENEQKLQVEMRKNQRKVEQLTPFIKKDFLQMILSNHCPNLLANKFLELKDLLTIDTDEKWFMVVGQMITKANEIQDLFYLDELVQADMHPKIQTEFFVCDKDVVVWLIQPQTTESIFVESNQINWDKVKDYCRRIFESVQGKQLVDEQYKVNFIIGSGSIDLTKMQTDFIEVYHYCKYLLSFTEDVLLIDQDKIHAETGHGELQKWKKQLIVLESEMASGNEQKAVQIVEELYEQFTQHSLTNLEMTEFIISITEILLDFLRNQDLYKRIKKINHQEIQNALQQLPVLFQSKTTILVLVNEIVNYQAALKADGKSKVIATINQFIYDNIDKDVSLTAIADYTHFNPSYLSRYYKEEVGKNLSDVINDIRIKKAKYYLTETMVPINEIATNLGFNSPSYFTLYFKKNTLQSPQEYREKTKEVKKVK